MHPSSAAAASLPQSPLYVRQRRRLSSGDADGSLRGLYRNRWSADGATSDEAAEEAEEEEDGEGGGGGRGRKKRMDEQQLRLAGLREHALLGLFCWLAVLSLLALFLLGLHIALSVVLQMSPRGMRSLRIFAYENAQSGHSEPAVHFTASEVHLGKVVAQSGKVLGPRDRELNVRGSRVVLGQPENGTRLLLQEGQCRVEGVDHFQIRQPGTGKMLFSARHPLVSVDRRIKRIAAGHIVTNKLRAPVDEELRIVGEDVSWRGNERIRMEAKRVAATGNRIGLKTTDDGSIRMSARRIHLGSKWRTLPVSPSPALTASVDAFRVCLCRGSRPKLFVVPGNRPCGAPTTICQQ